jgi:hypothetical protein
MTVNAPVRPHSGTMDVDEFMAFIETRPKEERWHLIEGIGSPEFGAPVDCIELL